MRSGRMIFIFWFGQLHHGPYLQIWYFIFTSHLKFPDPNTPMVFQGIAVNLDMQYLVTRVEETSEHPSRVLILGSDLLAITQAAVGRLHVIASLAGAYTLGPLVLRLR